MTHTLEAACRRIGGDGKHGPDYSPAPGAYVEAVWMLDEGWPPSVVEDAVWRLQRVAWMHRIGILTPPWEWTRADILALTRRAPWTWPDGVEPRQLTLDLEPAP